MKWNNIGHELDDFINFYDLDINKDLSVFAYGDEAYGERLYEYGRHRNLVEGYIVDDLGDNILLKQDTKNTLTYSEFFKKKYDAKIVITAKGEKAQLIEDRLKKHGKQKYKNYYLWDEFVRRIYPLFELYRYDFLHILHAQISLTERCTLKCKFCCHGCNYVDNTRKDAELPLQMVKRSADVLFSNFDRIDRFALLGGEPFLYENLYEVTDYIGKKYREKVNELYFITNGTIVPETSVLELCKKYKISIHISNYSYLNTWLKDKYDILARRLDEIGVTYVIEETNNTWLDFGFVSLIHTEDEAMELINTCGSQCREIRDNKFYYCIMARSYSENTTMGIGTEDYFDLSPYQSFDKKMIFEYCMGYSHKGYLEMCRYCNGMNTTKIIPAGEQMLRNY